MIGGGTASNGASQISLAGANNGSNLTAVRNLFTVDDHAALTHGIHEIEAGFWLQRIQANDNLAQSQYGQASFGSLTSFLQGTIATFTVVVVDDTIVCPVASSLENPVAKTRTSYDPGSRLGMV